MSETQAIQIAVELTKAIQAGFSQQSAATLEHAKAILELAQAIREHTQSQFLVEDDSDEDDSPRFYMDGTPVQ